jgi:S1-C subfamily serine protease
VNAASAVYQQVGPSVVQVNVTSQSRGRAWFGGSGTGVVVDDSGLVLTNNHVTEGGRAITVQFSDGTTRSAEVLGTDSGNDLALLKVDLPDGVPAARLGDSGQTRVGDKIRAGVGPCGDRLTQGEGPSTDRKGEREAAFVGWNAAAALRRRVVAVARDQERNAHDRRRRPAEGPAEG